MGPKQKNSQNPLLHLQHASVQEAYGRLCTLFRLQFVDLHKRLDVKDNDVLWEVKSSDASFVLLIT